MKEISNAELDCLRRIAKGYSKVASPCAESVLRHLLTMGLIEHHPAIWMPLEMAQSSYHITLSGSHYLRQWHEENGNP